jgi:hypothetical protein
VAVLGGCTQRSDPERTALAFLEIYAFSADQESALRLADGPAAEKLRAELADVRTARTSGEAYAAGPRRPALRRVLVGTERSGENTVVYTYRIEVRPKGGTPTYQRMLVQVRRTDGKWAVMDYQMWAEDPTRARAQP